jgi:hypothetical protein
MPTATLVNFDPKWTDNEGFITNIEYPFAKTIGLLLPEDKRADYYVGSFLKGIDIMRFKIAQDFIEHDLPQARVMRYNGSVIKVLDLHGTTIATYARLMDSHTPFSTTQTYMLGQTTWRNVFGTDKAQRFQPETMFGYFTTLDNELRALLRMVNRSVSKADAVPPPLRPKNDFIPENQRLKFFQQVRITSIKKYDAFYNTVMDYSIAVRSGDAKTWLTGNTQAEIVTSLKEMHATLVEQYGEFMRGTRLPGGGTKPIPIVLPTQYIDKNGEPL